jgi:hypothetical protein
MLPLRPRPDTLICTLHPAIQLLIVWPCSSCSLAHGPRSSSGQRRQGTSSAHPQNPAPRYRPHAPRGHSTPPVAHDPASACQYGFVSAFARCQRGGTGRGPGRCQCRDRDAQRHASASLTLNGRRASASLTCRAESDVAAAVILSYSKAHYGRLLFPAQHTPDAAGQWAPGQQPPWLALCCAAWRRGREAPPQSRHGVTGVIYARVPDSLDATRRHSTAYIGLVCSS